MIVPEDWQRLAFGVSLACMGPIAFVCDLLTAKPKTQWLHHGVVVLRAFAFLVVGAVLHWNPSPTRDPMFFWMVAVATQLLLVTFLPERDPQRMRLQPLRDGMVCVIPAGLFFNAVFIISWLRMALSESPAGLGDDNRFAFLWAFSSSPHLSLEMAAWLAIVYSVWKSLLWYYASIVPFSQGQHKSYWPWILKRSSPSHFWMEAHTYLQHSDPLSSPAVLDQMVSCLPMDVLRAYFAAQPKSHREDVQAAYDRLTQAVQRRMAILDPRTVPVFALYENDWPTLVHMFKHLDDAPSETYALPL